MAWFQQWLKGTEVPAGPVGEDAATGRPSGGPGPDPADEDDYPGQRLGLPESGRGSVASLPLRAGQFVIDAALAGLVAALFTYPQPPLNWSLLAWAILMVLPVAAIGMSPAMAMLGIRLLRIDRPDATGVGVLSAMIRTVLIFFVIPGGIVNRDGRGLQDRASRTVAIRTR